MKPSIILRTVTTILLLWLSAGKLAGQQGGKPNVVIIMTDQQTASALSAAGNPYLNTPNMDWLAARGMRFTRAYCSQPLCTPSRVSMLTGRMPHETGFTINAAPEQQLADRWQIIGKAVRNAGYQTGYVGKWHIPVKVSDKDKHGFDYIENTSRGDWKDASIPAYCALFLRQNKDKPFFLIASFENPHDICEWARGDNLRMDELEAPPAPDQCPPLPENHAIPANEPEIIREQQIDFKTYPTVNWSDNQWRQYRWTYYRLVEKVDVYIGRVIESLRRNGLLDNTVIIFTSDHGDGAAAHKWNQKQVLYEESVHVPFIISGINPRFPATSDLLVNTGIDIFPTVCDLTGASVPPGLNGISLKPEAFGGKRRAAERDFIVSETEFALNDRTLGIRGRTVITDRYKYIIYDKGRLKEQLFDLRQDPGEMSNLVSDNAHRGVLARLRSQLTEWCKVTNDDFNVEQILNE